MRRTPTKALKTRDPISGILERLAASEDALVAKWAQQLLAGDAADRPAAKPAAPVARPAAARKPTASQRLSAIGI